MSRKISLYVITLVLIIIGATLMVLRHQDTKIPYLSNEKRDIWVLEAKVEFSPIKDQPILASLNLPYDPPNFNILFEQSVSAGYGFNIVSKNGTRRGEWSNRSASSKQVLYYKVQVVKDKDTIDSEFVDQVYEEKIIWNESESLAAKDIISTAFSKSSNNETFTKELIKQLSSLKQDKNSSILLDKRDYIDVLSKLLYDAKVPHRISMALELKDARRHQSLSPIIEIYDSNKWILFDPLNSSIDGDKEYFLWYRGGKSLIDLVGGKNAQVTFSMLKQNMPSTEVAKEQLSDSGFGLFSLQRLPIEEQSFLKILLLLPIAALVTVFMRLLVGIKTSGTFSPVLIAMAFLQTSLFLGLTNFIVLIAIGLMIRGYLSSLNLLLVARIATIIIIVIFMVGFMTLLGYELGFNSRMSVAFFPIVIVSWMIERMSILWEEEGAKEVFVQGGGSLFVASLAYLVMQNGYMIHLSFNFPEVNLIIIALIILMGRYTGYRLLELYRFREFKR
ncbi:MAG: inactive transglutaminase family protein [Sulfurimonas sp.]|nr:inactive transglutaminase family protein [Sulfurimonadaceae bacterium]